MSKLQHMELANLSWAFSAIGVTYTRPGEPRRPKKGTHSLIFRTQNNYIDGIFGSHAAEIIGAAGFEFATYFGCGQPEPEGEVKMAPMSRFRPCALNSPRQESGPGFPRVRLWQTGSHGGRALFNLSSILQPRTNHFFLNALAFVYVRNFLSALYFFAKLIVDKELLFRGMALPLREKLTRFFIEVAKVAPPLLYIIFNFIGLKAFFVVRIFNILLFLYCK